MSPWFSEALLRAQSDERLAALAREGHERAFAALVERYRRPLFAFACGLVPAGRAEDVVQHALLNAWSALRRGAEVRHVRGWLHQIVRHVALAAHKPGEDPLPDTVIDTHDTPAQVEERLLIAQTLRNLAALPDHQREAIIKTAMEGRSREEVATSLGVTEGAVRAMLHRARTTLRAAATAITPLPLAVWADRAAERSADAAAAGGGAAGLAAAAAKVGTVAAVTGAVATTVAGDRLAQRHPTPTQAPTAGLHATRGAARPPAVHRAPTSPPVRVATHVRPARVPAATSAPAKRASTPARSVAVRHTMARVPPTLIPSRRPEREHDASATRPQPVTRHDQSDEPDEQEHAVVADTSPDERDAPDTLDGESSGDGAPQPTVSGSAEHHAETD